MVSLEPSELSLILRCQYHGSEYDFVSLEPSKVPLKLVSDISRLTAQIK